MASNTQYKRIEDGQFNLVLPAGQPARDFVFTLDDLPAGRNPKEPILAWVVDTEVATQQLEVTLNNRPLTLTAQLPSDAYQTLHELVEDNVLHAANNKLTFKVKGGNGVMRISDVVLWWKYDA